MAVQWYRKAAAQGYPAAQYKLGEMYWHGIGVARDVMASAKWYLMAAELGYPRAQWNLWMAYSGGMGVPRDPVAAYKWASLAASQGIVGADKMAEVQTHSMTQKELAEAKRSNREWLAAYQKQKDKGVCIGYEVAVCPKEMKSQFQD